MPADPTNKLAAMGLQAVAVTEFAAGVAAVLRINTTLLPAADCYRLVAASSVALGSGLDVLQAVVAHCSNFLPPTAPVMFSLLQRNVLWLNERPQEEQQCSGEAGAAAGQLLRMLTATVAKPERLVRLLSGVCHLMQLVRQDAGELESC